MAPLKFEDKIKEKLEQRTIKPSHNTWERLTSELDEKEGEKKAINKTWFYGIAASLVGFLIIASFFTIGDKTINNTVVDLEQSQKNESKVEIVEHKEETTLDLNKADSNNVKLSVNQNIRTELVTSSEKSKIIPERHQSKRDKGKEEVALHKKMQINEIVAIETVNTQKGIKTEVPDIISKEVINDKVAGVVAQVQQMESNNIEVTEEEINKLLQKAQREITSERIINSDRVSATALLQDVEAELDETFKERVFQALKTGFQKVKTAVAERNQ